MRATAGVEFWRSRFPTSARTPQQAQDVTMAVADLFIDEN